MAIIPDTKNWTWVLERRCPDCGLDASTLDPRSVVGLLRTNAAEWVEVLQTPHVRVRPDESTWSPLEYGCHVRDVFVLFRERLMCMLTEHSPVFANWDQDATATESAYNEQDPLVVSAELLAAAQALADAFETVQGDQWSRTGERSDGASFTVETFARYLIHDPVHHLWDVRSSAHELRHQPYNLSPRP